MTSAATTIKEYLEALPEDRKGVIKKLLMLFKKHLPKGFEPIMSYGMITFCVPHSLYPKGYHCNPKQALPFISIASQKNFIAIYHMGLYALPNLLNWFTTEHATASSKKLDMGKSCIRYKKQEDIPFTLLQTLATKISVDEWIAIYEKNYVK
jgi:hypothetical protein